MKKFGAFLMGLTIGILLGAVIAPEPGPELRKKLKEKLKKPDINQKLSKIKSILTKYEVE
ncbi:MAG: hypothetical protein ACPLN0_06795 [Candidatus Hydrothermia bacterium]